MYDLYNVSTIATATHDTFPTNLPLIAWSDQLNVKLANGTSFPYTPFAPVPRWVQQDQRRAYYACVSSIDEHVGVLRDTLRRLGLENNTAIVMHADHVGCKATDGVGKSESGQLGFLIKLI